MLATKEKCPYCHHGEQGFIKPLIRDIGETGDMGEMDYHEAAFLVLLGILILYIGNL